MGTRVAQRLLGKGGSEGSLLQVFWRAGVGSRAAGTVLLGDGGPWTGGVGGVAGYDHRDQTRSF